MFEIKVDQITGRLQNRLVSMFRFADSIVWRFGCTITPVVDIDELSWEWKHGGDNLDLSPVVGNVAVAVTVPEGEEWRLYEVWREATVGTCVVTFELEGGSGLWHRCGAMDTGNKTQDIPSVVMTTGARVGVSTTGNGADNSTAVYWLYKRRVVK